MTLNAYVLAADPTWLRESVLAYYPWVERIVVAYDREGRGWTGASIPTEDCLAILRSLDGGGKMEFLEGDFAARPGETLLEADTRQRRAAQSAAAEGADWVLQIDTDELLPDFSRLFEGLERAGALGVEVVEWPMRVLFRRLRSGKYLEVASARGVTHFEYPGPVAIRPSVELAHCRRADVPFLRCVVEGDVTSLQVRRPQERGEHRAVFVAPSSAIWHNSWARSPAVIRRKINTWSHNQGWRSWLFYYKSWLPSPVTWPAMRDFHPFDGSLWHQLRVVDVFGGSPE